MPILASRRCMRSISLEWFKELGMLGQLKVGSSFALLRLPWGLPFDRCKSVHEA